MKIPEVTFISIADMLMVGAGYAAFISTTPAGVWPLFAFSMCCYGIIVANLLSHLKDTIRKHAGTPEAKAFKFLSVWTIFLWCFYPLLFVLVKTHVMNLDQESIVYCVLDILAKCECRRKWDYSEGGKGEGKGGEGNRCCLS